MNEHEARQGERHGVDPPALVDHFRRHDVPSS
jgi:hypothetical protein